MSASASRGVPRVKASVFGDSIVASTIRSATWIPSSRTSCAAAWVSARVAWAPADQMPRPGIARRAEPPVTWMSVPPAPPSRSVADAGRQEHERLLRHRRGPAAEALDRRVADRAAAEAAVVRGRARRGHRVDDQAGRAQLVAHARERLAECVGVARVGDESERAALADRGGRLLAARDRRAAPAAAARGGRRSRRRGCARRAPPPRVRRSQQPHDDEDDQRDAESDPRDRQRRSGSRPRSPGSRAKRCGGPQGAFRPSRRHPTSSCPDGTGRGCSTPNRPGTRTE